MIRTVSSCTVWATTSKRPEDDMPNVTKRLSSAGGVVVTEITPHKRACAREPRYRPRYRVILRDFEPL